MKTIFETNATAVAEQAFLRNLDMTANHTIGCTGLQLMLEGEDDAHWFIAREEVDAITVSVLEARGWIQLTSSDDEPTPMVHDCTYFRGYVEEWGYLVDENSPEVHLIVIDDELEFWNRLDWIWQMAVQYPDHVVVTQTDNLLDCMSNYIENDDRDRTNSNRLVELTETLNFLLENNLVQLLRVPPANRNIVKGDPDYVWKFLVKNPTKIHRDWLADRGLSLARGFQSWVLAERHTHSIPYFQDWESMYELPIRLEADDDIDCINPLELLGRTQALELSIVLADGETVIERPSFRSGLREITVSSFEDWILCRGCIDWEVDEQLASLIDIQMKPGVSS